MLLKFCSISPHLCLCLHWWETLSLRNKLIDPCLVFQLLLIISKAKSIDTAVKSALKLANLPSLKVTCLKRVKKKRCKVAKIYRSLYGGGQVSTPPTIQTSGKSAPHWFFFFLYLLASNDSVTRILHVCDQCFNSIKWVLFKWWHYY